MLKQKLMGGAGGVEPVYVEDTFSTYLYTGNGSTQTITNGIDLAGKGGLVWTKRRDGEAWYHHLGDTVRGAGNILFSNATDANTTGTGAFTAFSSTGFSFDAAQSPSGVNFASWTFRKQPKFFDVQTVTHTNGTANTIDLSTLGTVGCVIAKITTTTGGWTVWHRSLTASNNIQLNSTAAQSTTNAWLSVSGTTATLAAAAPTGTYVIYSFAHDAGGFGLSGTDNVISCGSFTTNASNSATVTLGYEPQWVLVKSTSTAGNWFLFDTMRGLSMTGSQYLAAQSSNAEVTASNTIYPTATGMVFPGIGGPNIDHIYIAIRRGPMKVPTDGTKVFSPVIYSGDNAGSRQVFSGGFSPDMVFLRERGSITNIVQLIEDRLRGFGFLYTPFTGAEAAQSSSTALQFNARSNVLLSGTTSGGQTNATGVNYSMQVFGRAPGFFDEVCYTGTSANKTEAHNLQKAPELWLVKSRSATTEWVFGSSLLGANEKIVMPSPNGRVTDTTVWNNTYPTASVLSLGTSSTTNASGVTFVGYLMATAAGVSKVGTYTGNGSSQTIDCGFTGGARFVMIIRATASTAQDIYVWDSARGIVAGNDPRLSLNTTAAEVTTLDSVDATSIGFIVNTDASNVNVNGAVYLYWSIA
jgi:hypothetical protein